MNNIIRKLTSRKFWVALAVVTTGVSVALGGDASQIESVGGMIAALIGAMTYIITEGAVDAKNKEASGDGEH